MTPITPLFYFIIIHYVNFIVMMNEIYVPHILPIYKSPYPRWRFYISPHPLVVEL